MRYGLKERLLGALVLIALAVIFVPFLLEEKRPSAPISDKIITPEPPESVKSTVKKPVAPKLPPSLNEQQKQQVVENNKNLPKSGLTLKPEGGVDAWAIQVASFGDSTNAKRLVKQLEQKNYHAYWRKINAMAVVFIGPYLSQNEGRNVQDKLLQEQGLKTLLTGYVPEYEARIKGSLPTSED
ncbi:SPOR domain-containing protein [Marinospirillum insulare]|uniref:Cell division protein n=1 Tax=Marinospirillum insulare TaxID=217169 RepID=A0ABQ6A4A7_9GAMM|nr:SPOR domain-containing protein [Marinospirillum insulare]GLR64940.1 cell division protein [Marinospirillum insulare]